jgi:hypothetical protein
MKLADADRKKLPSLLDELASAVEELLLSGLTTASEATRQTLTVAFQEASRMRLLRLGSTLRVASEELGRFTRNEADFSRKRLTFFLNRAWLLSHGLARALREKNEAEFERLLWVPASTPVERLEVVTLGVAKKIIAGTVVTFEFRMRTVSAVPNIPTGQRLIWARVEPIKPGSTIPPEALVHLPQKQKFKPIELLQGKVAVIEKAAVSLDEYGGRISLGDQSSVKLGSPFTDWKRFQQWNAAAALARMDKHQPSPLDLEVELQEEVVLPEWEIGSPVQRDDGAAVFPITVNQITLDAIASPGVEGKALKKSLEDLRKKKARPPLFGLLHYEMCRLVLQPLAVFGKNGPEYLTLSDEKLDRKELLKGLNLTG